MPEKDFAVGSVGIPSVGQVSKKPCYLITLSNPAGKKPIYFVALDKPDLLNGFIATKGFFSDESHEYLVANFIEEVANTPLESRLDMLFPWHRVQCIRSLVFNANKPSTLVK